MAVEIKVPVLGESVVEATIAKWMKGAGEAVTADEPIVELETDKVTLEVPSPVNGVLADIIANEGDTVGVDALLALVEEGATATAKPAEKPAATSPAPETAPETAPAPTAASAPAPTATAAASVLSPAVRKMVEENNLNPAAIAGTGKDGRLTKADVQKAIAGGQAKMTAAAPAAGTAPVKAGPRASDAREERVPMSRLRRMIAGRLKEAQNTAAMLTTFNEVDMSAVMALRLNIKMILKNSMVPVWALWAFSCGRLFAACKSFQQ